MRILHETARRIRPHSLVDTSGAVARGLPYNPPAPLCPVTGGMGTSSSPSSSSSSSSSSFSPSSSSSPRHRHLRRLRRRHRRRRRRAQRRSRSAQISATATRHRRLPPHHHHPHPQLDRPTVPRCAGQGGCGSVRGNAIRAFPRDQRLAPAAHALLCRRRAGWAYLETPHRHQPDCSTERQLSKTAKGDGYICSTDDPFSNLRVSRDHLRSLG